MTRASGSIDIAAPADVVWQWIVEPARYLQWNPDFSEYNVLQLREEGMGTTYQMVGVKGGSPITLDCEITEWVENARFSFRGRSRDGTQAEGTFSIEATKSGCRVDFEEELKLPGVKGKIIGALFLKRAKTKNIEECLQRLKEAAEKSASP